VLDYPLNDFIWNGVRRALLTMAEIQLAAGAKSVHPVHEMAEGYTSWSAAKKAIESLPYKPLLTRVVSAHVMGGCAMSDDTKLGIVSSMGRYHGIANLSVHDGSIFPTSIGANPQLSIYGITSRLASKLAEELTGKPAPVPQPAV
jgi:choline dehydrogenase-like flavoprotein